MEDSLRTAPQSQPLVCRISTTETSSFAKEMGGQYGVLRAKIGSQTGLTIVVRSNAA